MGYDIDINKKMVVNSLAMKLQERLFSQGVNLVVQILLARLLLPEDFGSFAIILAITNYAEILVQSGLATAIVQKKDIELIDISTLMTASLSIACVLYVVLFCIAPFVANYYGMPVLLWAMRVQTLQLFLNAISSVQTAILSRKMQFKKIFVRTAISIPLSGIVGIVMAVCDFGIWALIVYNLVAALTIVLFMSFDRELHVPLRFSWLRAKKLYSFSGKILLTSLITGGHDTLRTMVIGKSYTSENLAYYNRAYTYSNYITSSVNTSISSVLLPTFSSKQTDLAELKKMARRSVNLSSFVMFPVLIGVAVVSRPLVLLLLTSKWEASIPFLMVFCILRLPGCVMSVDKQVYYALGRSGVNLMYEIGLFIANITTLIFTIQHSILAVAIGATVVELLGSFAIYCISSRVYAYSLLERISDLSRPFINSCIMAGCVWTVTLFKFSSLITLLIQVALGVAIYVFLSYLTNKDTFKYVIDLIKPTINKKRNNQGGSQK